MSWQTVIKLSIVSTSVSILVGCGSVQSYQDTSALENPPELEIVKVPYPKNKRDVDMGLGDVVLLVGGTKIFLKQSFNRAWGTLETALEFNDIKITDRNRKEGRYYVQYDPDTYKDKDKEEALLGLAAFFLFQNQYNEATYLIHIAKHLQGVSIKIDLSEEKIPDLLDDGEDLEFDDEQDDGSRRLLRHLYVTLRNDLPLK